MDVKQAIKNLDERLDVIGRMQIMVMEELSRRNPEFQRKAIAQMLAIDEVREGFTEYIANDPDVDDAIKVFMMGLNEFVKQEEE
jgi:hypothetical protein